VVAAFYLVQMGVKGWVLYGFAGFEWDGCYMTLVLAVMLFNLLCRQVVH
jgi:hypothetical protein